MSTTEKAPVSYRFRRDRASALRVERLRLDQLNLFLHQVVADLVVAADRDPCDDALASFGDRERDVHLAGRAVLHERVVRADVVVTLRPVEIADLVEGVLGSSGHVGLARHQRKL